MKIINVSAVWCPACLIMKKVWKEIADDIENIDIINYDYDIDEDEISKYNVGEKLPVIIMLDDNDNEVKRLIGEKTKEEIKEFIGV